MKYQPHDFSLDSGLTKRIAKPRVIVTGGAGFVGRHLVYHLQSLGCEVISWSSIVDIRDASLLKQTIHESQPSAVIHLAAIASPTLARGNPRMAWEVNVTGTFNLAEAVLTHARKAKFVFVGSSESYGASFNSHREPINEDAALSPISIYGATKAAADLMIGQLAREGLRSIRLRPFNHTGPGQDPTYVVADFARQIVEIERSGNKGILCVGNLEAERDFLDVRDVVRAYADAALAEDLADGRAINIASGKPVSIGALLDLLLAASPADIVVRVDKKKLRPNEIKIASGDPTLAERLLGWLPRIHCEKTMRDVLEYWRTTAESEQTVDPR